VRNSRVPKRFSGMYFCGPPAWGRPRQSSACGGVDDAFCAACQDPWPLQQVVKVAPEPIPEDGTCRLRARRSGAKMSVLRKCEDDCVWDNPTD